MKSSMNMDEAVLHYEMYPKRSACGRELPTAGFFTDDLGVFDAREGTRCKSCWRCVQKDIRDMETAFDRPEAKRAREGR